MANVPSNTVYEDGQTVTGDNLSTFVQVCPTVNDARGFIGSSQMSIQLEGFSAPNDGGQGQFYWNAAATAPDDGGVTTIVPDGSGAGAWVRLGGFGTPAFDVSNTSLIQNVTTNVLTQVLFDTYRIDTNSGWSNGNNNYTVPAGGRYFVYGTVAMFGTFAAPENLAVVVTQNSGGTGLYFAIPPSFTGGPLSASVSSQLICSIGDVLALNCKCNGTDLQIRGDNDLQVNFGAFRIGP